MSKILSLFALGIVIGIILLLNGVHLNTNDTNEMPSKKQLMAMDVIDKQRFDQVVEFCYDGVKYIKMGTSISIKMVHSELCLTPDVETCESPK